MNRAWLIDLLSALIMGLLMAGVVLAAGGPAWAAIGFGLLVYLRHPRRAIYPGPTFIPAGTANWGPVGDE